MRISSWITDFGGMSWLFSGKVTPASRELVELVDKDESVEICKRNSTPQNKPTKKCFQTPKEVPEVTMNILQAFNKLLISKFQQICRESAE